MREMVEVVLWEDGTYEVEDTEPCYMTQMMYRYDGKGLERRGKVYICKKEKWKYYLMRMLSTKEIDDEIRELKKKKKAMEQLKEKIKNELREDNRNDD
jgi:hypothetical protein